MLRPCKRSSGIGKGKKMKTKKKIVLIPLVLLLLAIGVGAGMGVYWLRTEQQQDANNQSIMADFLTAVYTTDYNGRWSAVEEAVNERKEEPLQVYQAGVEHFVTEALLEQMSERSIPAGYDQQQKETPWTVEQIDFSKGEEKGSYAFNVQLGGEATPVTGTITIDMESGVITDFADDLPEAKVEIEALEPEPEPVVKDAKGIYVCIDPGHGGIDPGTHNPAEEAHYEKDDNLALGLAIRDKLKERGAKVLMTRDDDTFYKPSERCTIANDAGVNYFICLHRNYAESEAKGIEIWVATHASDESVMLGESLEKKLIEVGVSKSRGVQLGSQSGSGDYMVLRNTDMPGLLAEMGFMGNEEDNRLFEENLDGYADAFADAVVETWKANHKSNKKK